ncbi:hypothetical protein MRX96_022371 [Rhipicephalus microplus]
MYSATKVDTLPATFNTINAGKINEDTATSSREVMSVKTTASGQGQFEQAIYVVPAEIGVVRNYLTGAVGDRSTAPIGTGPYDSQKPGETSSDTDTSRNVKEIPERKTMSEPSFSNSKQTNTEGGMESGESVADHVNGGQKAINTATIKEESSFTDKETFRMPIGTEASTERSSTHIKVTDSVNSERPQEQNCVVPETNVNLQKNLSETASRVAPMAIQMPLSSLSQVLSQQPLKVVKRKVVLETVTKTVTEKKESVKAFTNQATGVEHKDSHLESTTKEEVKSKKEEETIESYDSVANVRQEIVSNPTVASITENRQAVIVSNPVLGGTSKAADSPKESVISHSAPDIKGVKEQTCQTPEKHKRPKQPVAIRVHDDTLAEDEEVALRKEEPGHMDLEPKSILKPLNRPAVHQVEESPPDKKHLGFQEVGKTESALPQPGPTKDGDDDSEEAAQPPPRFKFNRKDSIAVTKLRMMKQAEEFSEEEDDNKKGSDSFLASSAAPVDKHDERHPMFKPPVVIYNEEPQPASAADTVQSEKMAKTSISKIASMTQPLIEVTGDNASQQKNSNICDDIRTKDTPEVAKPEHNIGMATDEVGKKSKSYSESAKVIRWCWGKL